MRCIDKRIEESAIYIKWDDTPEDDWLICIYLKDDSPTEGIVIEDKTDPEKNKRNGKRENRSKETIYAG